MKTALFVGLVLVAIPYLLALAVLAGGIGRTRAPAALGKRLFVSDNF